MGFFDKLRPMADKAKAAAQDPANQAKAKEFAQKAMDKRRQQGQRRQFAGGHPGSVGYPYEPGMPLYGTYAEPGWYDDGGNYYDSDGDGIPDNQDPTPYGGDPDMGFDSGDGGQETQWDDSGDSGYTDDGSTGSDYSGSDYSGSDYNSSDYSGGDYGGGSDSGGGGGSDF